MNYAKCDTTWNALHARGGAGVFAYQAKHLFFSFLRMILLILTNLVSSVPNIRGAHICCAAISEQNQNIEESSLGLKLSRDSINYLKELPARQKFFTLPCFSFRRQWNGIIQHHIYLLVVNLSQLHMPHFFTTRFLWQ